MVGHEITDVVLIVGARVLFVTLGRVGSSVSGYVGVRWTSIGRVGTGLGLTLGM